jgi:SAM-dependent methyltransferase
LARESLDYYLEWKPRFWEAPFLFGLSRVGPGFEGKKVLEIGCRRGRMCSWFARRGAWVVGGDISFRRSPEAVAASRGSGRRIFYLVRFRGERLPFRDGSFDIVFTKAVFTVLEKETALGEILRVLAPGGYVWLLENMKLNPFAAVVRFLRHWRGFGWVRHIGYLTYDELESYAPAFSRYEHREFHLLTPLCRFVPLPRGWLRRIVEWETRALRRFRPLARFAWLTCVVGEK